MGRHVPPAEARGHGLEEEKALEPTVEEDRCFLNLFVVIVCFTLLMVLLVLLGIWQQRISESQRERVVADIRDAKEHQTDRPLAQHPQIDVQTCIGCGSCVAACPEDNVLGLVDGVAHVIHGARCIGHGRCEAVCPVGAIKVGLGDLLKSPNLPALSGQFETSVPGIYIAGELGGFALIRIAVEQGARVVEQIAGEVSRRREAGGKTREDLDVLIVGAGPAGLAASLKATERRLNYLTIDQDDIGGTIRKYPRRKLTLTGPVDMPLVGRIDRHEFLKEELLEFWQHTILSHQLRIRTGVKLQGVEREGSVFVARTSSGSIRARRIVLALGRRGSPRKLGVPGEDAEKVLYHLLDAATYTQTRILVVGGGDSAVEAATALASQSGNEVTLSYRRGNFFRLKSRNEERLKSFGAEGRLRVLLSSNVQRIDPDLVTLSVGEEGATESLELSNDFVFVMAGGEPPYPLLRGMGVQFNGDESASAQPIPSDMVEVS